MILVVDAAELNKKGVEYSLTNAAQLVKALQASSLPYIVTALPLGDYAFAAVSSQLLPMLLP